MYYCQAFRSAQLISLGMNVRLKYVVSKYMAFCQPLYASVQCVIMQDGLFL